MGTTESIFYDEEPEPADSLPVALPAAAAAPPPRREAPHPSQSHAAGPPRHPPPRPGPPHSRKPPATSVLRLSGLVLGMAQSGKQTLLQRLEGKDPFTDQEVDDYSERSSIVAPYVPPPEYSVWDRIQLRVDVSRSVPNDRRTAISNNLDFCVILINRRHDPSRQREYLNETIRDILRKQGHRDEHDGEEATGSAVQKPVCICLLLNFRDMESDSDQWMDESDVQSLTMEVLQDFPSLEPSKLVLQCGSTSLLNCYGLNILHHFIYQCYLQRRRSDLELLLDGVTEAQAVSRQAPSLSYNEFLGIAASGDTPKPVAPIPKKSKKHSKKERKRKEALEASQRANERIRHDSDADSTDEVHDGDEREPSPLRTGRRRIIPTGIEDVRQAGSSVLTNEPSSAQSDRPPFASTKQALEAFLASDDEDDVPNDSSAKPAYDSDSDKDDDYFYDEYGNRTRMEPPAMTKATKKKAKKIPQEERVIDAKASADEVVGERDGADSSKEPHRGPGKRESDTESVSTPSKDAISNADTSTIDTAVANGSSLSTSPATDVHSISSSSDGSKSESGADHKRGVVNADSKEDDDDAFNAKDIADSAPDEHDEDEPARQATDGSQDEPKEAQNLVSVSSKTKATEIGAAPLDAAPSVADNATISDKATDDDSASHEDASNDCAEETIGSATAKDDSESDHDNVSHESRSASPVDAGGDSPQSNGSNSATAHKNVVATDSRVQDDNVIDDDRVIDMSASNADAGGSRVDSEDVTAASATVTKVAPIATAGSESDSDDSGYVIESMPLDDDVQAAGARDDNEPATDQGQLSTDRTEDTETQNVVSTPSVTNDDSSEEGIVSPPGKSDAGSHNEPEKVPTTDHEAGHRTDLVDKADALAGNSKNADTNLPAHAQTHHQAPVPQVATVTAASSGLSDAARAAIAAAQLDFERMVNEPNTNDAVAKKPKMHKKDGEKKSKKKKKEKKAKRTKADSAVEEYA